MALRVGDKCGPAVASAKSLLQHFPGGDTMKDPLANLGKRLLVSPIHKQASKSWDLQPLLCRHGKCSLAAHTKTVHSHWYFYRFSHPVHC